MIAGHKLNGSDEAAQSLVGNSQITGLLSAENKRRRSNKPIIEGDGYRVSYRELFDNVCRLGTFFQQQNLTCGDRVVVISDDDSAIITLFFGLIRHGITVTILNPQGSEAEMVTLSKAMDPAMMFVDRPVIERVTAFSDRDDVVAIDPGARRSRGPSLFRRQRSEAQTSGFPGILSCHPPSTQLPDEIPEETPAYILFTSGSTSRPKGVVITHRNLFAQMDTFVNHYGFDADTRLLNVLPFHHADGLTQGAVASFVAGGTLLRPMRFRVERIAELIDSVYRLRISHFVTVPSMLALIDQIAGEVSDAFQSRDFRFVISTAAYLDESLWRRFEERFAVRVVNVYGLTETVCEACYCGPDERSFRYGTVGKPIDCEARVVEADGSLAAIGGPGELVLQGANVMAGYFRMPEETAEVLRGGWFYTGDIAEIDHEGFVRIVGRKKSVINSGGYNIYPEDVTNVIQRMPEVLEAITFGLPDKTWGEKVVSCVIPKTGVTLTDSTLATHFLAEASREKLPREFHFLEEFPRGPAGKVLIEQLKAEIQAKRERDAVAVDSTALKQEQFFAVTAKVFKIDVANVMLESTPDQIESWDSLAHVEWLMALETAYAIRFEPKDIFTIKSVGQALTALEGKMSQ